MNGEVFASSGQSLSSPNFRPPRERPACSACSCCPSTSATTQRASFLHALMESPPSVEEGQVKIVDDKNNTSGMSCAAFEEYSLNHASQVVLSELLTSVAFETENVNESGDTFVSTVGDVHSRLSCLNFCLIVVLTTAPCRLMRHWLFYRTGKLLTYACL